MAVRRCDDDTQIGPAFRSKAEPAMTGFEYIPRLLSITAIVLACQSFNLASGQTGDAKTKPSASVSGRITIGDKPAPGISVSAVLNSNTGENVLAQTTSDSEGNYRSADCPAGRLR